MQKNNVLLAALLLGSLGSRAQVIRLDSVLELVGRNHPQLKMYDAEIRSMNAAAAGAKSWMPPELSTGFWMMPYNPDMWKRDNMGGPGMGQYMVGAQQMIPNRKRQQAEGEFMNAMSSVEAEKKHGSLNELQAQAKSAYFKWVIAQKKLRVIDQNEKLLDFMIRNAEIRYRNNMGKLNAYYKAKASLAQLASMRLMVANEGGQQRIRLQALMAAEIPVNTQPDTNMVYELRPVSIDTALIAGQRSDLKALGRQKELNLLQQQVEKARLKPEFGLKYDHMFGFGGLPQQFNLMAMIRLPMAAWSSRMNRANIESLRYRNESIEQQRQMILLETIGMASGMKKEIETKQKQVDLYEASIIPALKNNYQTMLLAYEQNTEELFMLYDAWETLNMTQLQYLDDLAALFEMKIQFDRILENR